MKREIVHQSVKRLTTVVFLFCLAISCTDLDAPVYDKVSNFWLTPKQIEQGAAQAYVKLRSYAARTFWLANPMYTTCMRRVLMRLLCQSVDLTGLISVFGSTFGSTHGHQPAYVSRDGWQFVFNGVDGTNLIIESLQNLPTSSYDAGPLLAEMQTLAGLLLLSGP